MSGEKEVTVKTEEPERHPSFGWARVNQLSSSLPGVSLFDSEIRHHHFIRLEISHAERTRDLNQDWIRGDLDDIVTVDMSMAQWGALVSSFGSSGVPVTISRLNGEAVENAPYQPRLQRSLDEIDTASDQTYGKVAEAVRDLEEAFERKAGRREMKSKIFNVAAMLGNAKPNNRFVAKRLTEHVENVVTKARADIEATVRMAAEKGLNVGAVAGELLPQEDEHGD